MRAAAGAGPLEFFCRFAEREGAACERGREASLLLLPATMQRALDLPEEVTITDDPEVAREDGAVLLVHGHPLLDRVATTVLDRGDIGWAQLAWPASRTPAAVDLAEHAREAIQVDHGRIEHAGPPGREVFLPVLRVGVLVSYAVSLEDRFQEREEVWIDGRTGVCLEPALLAHVARRTPEPGIDRTRPFLDHDVATALSAADRLAAERAMTRRLELASQTRGRREEELARAAAYYQATLASIAARKAAASPDREEVLSAQLEVTAAERDRRLAEIAERFEPRHEQTPYRLHVIGVPAVSIALNVRRGARVFPLSLLWVLGAGRFAAQPCPRCGSIEALVAGRDHLGCRECLPSASLGIPTPPAATAPSSGAPGGERAARQQERVDLKAANPEGRAGRDRAHLAGRQLQQTRGREQHADRARGREQHADGARGREQHAGETRGGEQHAGQTRGGEQHAGQTRGGEQHAGGITDGHPAIRPTRKALAAKPGAVRSRPDLERLDRLGDKLVMALWTAVVEGKRWRSKGTVPHSPMSALARIYGHPGPLRAIGVPHGGEPQDLQIGGTVPGEPARGRQPATCHATTGRLLTSAGIIPFTLRWEQVPGAQLVGELLPGWALKGFLRQNGVSPESLVDFRRPQEPTTPLDPEARLLWDETARRFGLHVALRCLALWGRAQAEPGLPEVGDEPVRRAIVQTVLSRAHIDLGPDDQLSLLGPSPTEIAEALAHVERVVGRPSARFW